VGRSGQAFHFDGVTWEEIGFELHGSLDDVWVSKEGDVFVAGCRWEEYSCVAVIYQYMCQ